LRCDPNPSKYPNIRTTRRLLSHIRKNSTISFFGSGGETEGGNRRSLPLLPFLIGALEFSARPPLPHTPFAKEKIKEKPKYFFYRLYPSLALAAGATLPASHPKSFPKFCVRPWLEGLTGRTKRTWYNRVQKCSTSTKTSEKILRTEDKFVKKKKDHEQIFSGS